MILAFACGSNPPQPAESRTAGHGPRIVFPDGYAVTVEVAADDATRQQGLMYRDRLPADGGMIFFFPQSGDYPFWMKNTLIALDMIWIDDARRIVKRRPSRRTDELARKQIRPRATYEKAKNSITAGDKRP